MLDHSLAAHSLLLKFNALGVSYVGLQSMSFLFRNSLRRRIINAHLRSLLAFLCVCPTFPMATVISTAQQQTSAPTATKLAELSRLRGTSRWAKKVKSPPVVKDESGNKTNAASRPRISGPPDSSAGENQTGPRNQASAVGRVGCFRIRLLTTAVNFTFWPPEMSRVRA